MKDRFNLEEEIAELYNFSSQLATINGAILKQQLTNDEIVKVVDGMRVMLNLHADKMNDTLCECFNLKQ